MPKPKGKSKGPWQGPSHHRNQKKGTPVAAPKAGERKGAGRGNKPLTKQREYMSRKDQPFDFFLVIDFECTCEMEDRTWPHEIIEFPAVLMDADTGEFVAEFQEYVRPTLRPTLTPFCKNLTGIQQDTVDKADTLPVVVARFVEWLVKSVPEGALVCCATDGPTDLETFMYRMAIKRDGVRFPEVMFTYVDVKLTFCKYFKVRTKPKLHAMLKELGLKFEGQLHSGIDDTKNIARLMNAMMDRGAQFCFPFQIRHRAHQVVEETFPGAFRCPTKVPADLLRPVDKDLARRADEEDAAAAEADGGDGDEEQPPASPSALASGDDDGVVDVLDVPDKAAAAAGGADSDDSDGAASSSGGSSSAGDDGEGSSSDSDGEVSAAVAAVAAKVKKNRPAPKPIRRDLDRVITTSERQHRRQQVHNALASAEDLAAQRALAASKSARQDSAGGIWNLFGGKGDASKTRFLVMLGLISTLNTAVAVWMFMDAPPASSSAEAEF